jgi:hypothetical protein
MSKAKSVKKVGRGRPLANIVYPRGRFTREDLFAANPHVCKLTIVNRTNKDMKGPKSLIVRLKGETGEATSESGRGRPPHLYLRRSARDAGLRLQAINKASTEASINLAPEVVENEIVAA